MHGLDPWVFSCLGTPIFPSPQNNIPEFHFNRKWSGRRSTIVWMCYLYLNQLIYTLQFITIYLYLSTAVGHLHSVLNHSNGTLLMDLVGAWQDLTTAERILCRVQKVDLITIQ